MEKQEIIQHLTDMLGVIQNAYFKGKMEGHQLWVHEHMDDSAAISIDLYNFGGDGEPVCDGLNPCTLRYDDGSSCSGWLYCMCYDPDDVSPLTFVFDTEGIEDFDVDPESVPEWVLQNIAQWLESAMQPLSTDKTNESNDTTMKVHGIMAIYPNDILVLDPLYLKREDAIAAMKGTKTQPGTRLELVHFHVV